MNVGRFDVLWHELLIDALVKRLVSERRPNVGKRGNDRRTSDADHSKRRKVTAGAFEEGSST